MKRPMMIEGRPFIRSSVSRTRWAPRPPAYSVRKRATRTPIGIAIAVPMPTMMAVPTSSGPIPSGAPLIRKSRSRALAPRVTTV